MNPIQRLKHSISASRGVLASVILINQCFRLSKDRRMFLSFYEVIKDQDFMSSIHFTI